MEIGCVTLSTETFVACRRFGCFLIDRIPSSSPYPPSLPFFLRLGFTGKLSKVHRELIPVGLVGPAQGPLLSHD